MRIVLEIIKILKNNYDLHIICKINPEDVRKGGITQEESIEICKFLEKSGVDSIQITARTISHANKDGFHPFFDYANKLVNSLDIPVILGGSLRDSNTMNKILNSSNIKFLSMSKPFNAQADFLAEWQENGGGVSICQNCNNCYGKKTSNLF